MVLTGYNYHEKPFKKGDLNNSYRKQTRSSKRFVHKQRKKRRENI